MSGRLADEVYRRQVDPGFRRDILLVFALHADDNGSNARPTVVTVADKVGCSVRTVYRHVGSWKADRVLTVTAKPRSNEGGGAMATVYAVDLTAIPWKPRWDQPDTHGGTLVTDQPDIGADQRDISADQPDRAVPSLSDQRPFQRPNQRPLEAQFEIEKDPNPNGQPKGAPKKELKEFWFKGEWHPYKRKEPKDRTA